MQFLSSSLPGQCLAAEDGSQFVDYIVGLLDFGTLRKEQLHTLLCPFAPFVRDLCQCISGSREQFHQRISGAEHRRLELLVFSGRLAAPGLALVLFGVRLAIPSAMGCVAFLAFFELAFLLADLGLGFTLATQPHLLDGVIAAPHDVEAVQDNGRIREGLRHDVRHTVGQVHRHLLDLQTLLLGNPEQNAHDIPDLGAADGRNNRPFLAMPFLVGQEREQVILQGGLVDAQTLADVFLYQNPVGGMFQLIPFRKVAQMMLVRALKIIAVREEELTKATCRHRGRIQYPLLKKPQTLRNNGCPRQQADTCSE